jgi:threonine dehydrogenase-like Zn-dependent dehydrogenase
MKGKMRQGVLRSLGNINCEIGEIPVPKAGEVLVKVHAVGICGSDIERVLKTGSWHYPTTLGHEFSGEIVEIGEEIEKFKVGDRIVANPMLSCGECEYCTSGMPNMCENYKYIGSSVNGAFAEYVPVREKNLFHLPDNVDYITGATIDPITIALHGVRQAKLEAGTDAVVFGCGPVGLFVIEWLKALGAEKVIAVDVVKEKLDIALKLGATIAINSLEVDPVEKLNEFTGGNGMALAFNITSTPITIDQAIKSLGKHGQLVCIGTPHSNVTISMEGFERILRREIKVMGSWCYTFPAHPNNEWQTAIDFVEEGKIISEPIISHKLKLEQVSDAFKMIKEKKEYFNKIIFLPQEK